jgi:hypothetical protein
LYFKKRRLFFKKLKDFGISGSNSYIKMFSNNLNELFKYKKKRDVILKAKNKESLKIILKISKKYPGINLKNGTYFITKPEAMNNVITFGYRKQKLITKTKRSPLKKSIAMQASKIESEITRASGGGGFAPSAPDFSKKVLSYSNNRRGNSHLKNNYSIPTMIAHGFFKKAMGDSSVSSHNPARDARFMGIYKKEPSVFPKRASINSLNIDAIFNPITKVNYIIEVNDFKIAQNKLQTSFNTSELYDTLAGLWPQTCKKNRISEIGPKSHSNFDKIRIDTQNQNQNQSASILSTRDMSRETSMQQNLSLNQLNYTNQPELTNLLQLNHELSALTKETIKHNIIFEIWTNGSMHPRDALNQALKNIIKIFVKLKNIQPFGDNHISLNKNSFILRSKPSVDIQKKLHDQRLTSPISSITPLNIKENKQINKINQILVKKIKMGAFKKDFLEKIDPLNETTFLSTYISPYIKSYYLNKTNLLQIFNFYNRL